ncbi:MAG: type II secretion system F family protein [Henriciella sp.]
MAKFAYRALNKDGSEVSGRQDAASEKSAFDELKDRGLYPVSITLEKPPRRLFGNRKLTRKDLSQTVRQLATLLSAGVPLLAAVESLVRSNAHPELSERASKLTQHLRSGEHLPSGLAKFYPELPIYVTKLAELGDATGKTAVTLTDAADRMASEDKLNSDLRSALTYPMILGIVGAGIILMMFLFVIPRFGALIDESGADISPWSRMVIGSGVWLQANWLPALLGFAAFVALIRFVIAQNAKAFSVFARKLPGIGSVLSRADLTTWCRTMGIALSNGAPLLTALDLAAGAVQSTDFAAQLAGVKRSVKGGAELDQAFSNSVHLADPMLMDLLHTGIRSATLDKMMILAADIYEEELQSLMKRLTAIAEPVAILLLSMIVGGLVISIVMAMTSLYQFDL